MTTPTMLRPGSATTALAQWQPIEPAHVDIIEVEWRVLPTVFIVGNIEDSERSKWMASLREEFQKQKQATTDPVTGKVR